MYKLQVIVDKLNIRSTPEADPSFTNWVGDMIKDETYTALRIVKGGIFEGTDNWFVDQNNLFTSAAAVSINAQEYINGRFDGQNILEAIDYNILLDIDNSIKSSGGENVIIGILDHPISTTIKLANDIIRPFHIADPLFNFHANFISGMIAGVQGVSGISNKVKIMELPIFNQRGSSSGINIDKIIEFVNDLDKPMILNISNSMDSRFNDSIKNLRKDVIVVACIGIDNELSSSTVRDPASQENVITVGALNKTSPRPILNSKVDFIVSNFKYVSYSKNTDSFAFAQGDSFSCAMVSSLIALLISSGKTSYDINSVKNQLSNISKSYSIISSLDSFNLINGRS